MIFPENYKFVGIKERLEKSGPIYFSTQYLISREGPRLYAVTSSGSGFMRELEEIELIACGEEIVFYPQRVDTRNRTLLVDLAYEITKEGKAKAVVFQGPDEHITFVKDPDPGQVLRIEVLDVSPPDPPWLVSALRGLEECGVLGDLMVRFVPRVLNLERFHCSSVYYPCRAGGLGRSLDCDIVVHERPRIVGCEVSREIFLANNPGKEHEFINVCPLHCQELELEPLGPFITRCCRSERRGRTSKCCQPGTVVHWGDGPWEIAEAVRCLVKDLRG